jgi:hypothetical protein
MTFVPYEAAQKTAIIDSDRDAMSRDAATARWAAERSLEWLAFWREDRQRAFFPCDLVAAAYLLHPELFRCVRVRPWISPHSWFWRRVLGDTGLFVDQQIDGEQGELRHRVVYCPSPSAGLHDAALADLTRSLTPPERCRWHRHSISSVSPEYSFGR